MSTTTDKIDPTVTLDKLIALLQGFRDKLTADGNSDTITRYEALGDTETLSKYYNKFGGGRALAGAILEVDGKVDKKADDLRIVLGGLGNASADTIEGVAFNSWVNVPPEFEIDMSGDIGSKLWMPGASFAIPHLDSGNPVDFPITGWQHDETNSQKSTATLRPFYASDGKLVRGTVEALLSTSTNSYTLHFKWEYAQTGNESGSGGKVLDITLSNHGLIPFMVNDTHTEYSQYDDTVANSEDIEALKDDFQSISAIRIVESELKWTFPVCFTMYDPYGDTVISAIAIQPVFASAGVPCIGQVQLSRSNALGTWDFSIGLIPIM